MSHTTVPLSFLMVNGSGRPTKPRCASSKSCLLLKSRYCCTARLAALVASVAGFGGVPCGCCAMDGAESARTRAAKAAFIGTSSFGSQRVPKKPPRAYRALVLLFPLRGGRRLGDDRCMKVDVAVPGLDRLPRVVRVRHHAVADEAAGLFLEGAAEVVGQVARQALPGADAGRAAGGDDHLR